MIKIEFPAHEKEIALAIGKALIEIGQCGTGPDSYISGDEASAYATERLAELSRADKETDEPCFSSNAPDASDIRTDEKAVPFDAEFCGNAAKPFYETGPREGQWKKRKGVGDSYYDEWYAEEWVKVAPPASTVGTTDTEVEKAKIDVGAALGNQQATTQPQAEVPANGGELMQWVSEKQTAGLLTPADVQAAYTALGIDVPALFGAEGGTHAPAIHAILVQKAGQ